jgi:hypothetical protein
MLSIMCFLRLNALQSGQHSHQRRFARSARRLWAVVDWRHQYRAHADDWRTVSYDQMVLSRQADTPRCKASQNRRRIRVCVRGLHGVYARLLVCLKSHLTRSLLQLHTTFAPFHDIPNDFAIINKVTHGHRPPRIPARAANGSAFTDAMWELVQLAWAQDENHRPSMTDVFLALHRQDGSTSSVTSDLAYDAGAIGSDAPSRAEDYTQKLYDSFEAMQVGSRPAVGLEGGAQFMHADTSPLLPTVPPQNSTEVGQVHPVLAQPARSQSELEELSESSGSADSCLFHSLPVEDDLSGSWSDVVPLDVKRKINSNYQAVADGVHSTVLSNDGMSGHAHIEHIESGTEASVTEFEVTSVTRYLLEDAMRVSHALPDSTERNSRRSSNDNTLNKRAVRTRK